MSRSEKQARHYDGVGVCSVVLTSRYGALSCEHNNVWQLCKAMPSYFHRTKAVSCQNRTHLDQKEASLSPTPPSTSPPQPHLPVVLVWQPNRDFFIFISLLEVRVPLNQRRCCHVFLPPSVFSPSQQSLYLDW